MWYIHKTKIPQHTSENERNEKKLVTKGHMLYDPTSMKCPEQTTPQKQEADSWLPGAGRGGDEH